MQVGAALDPEQVRAAAQAVRNAAAALRAMPEEARIEAIARAAQALLATDSPAGGDVRRELRASTGLCAPVIEHGLRTTLALFEREALRVLLRSRPPATAPARVATVVLAGNVFSASARPLLLPLACGTAVIAKAASADDALPRALQRALAATDPRLGEACAVLTFSHERPELLQALLCDAELVSAYGSDATIAALAAGLPNGARLLDHGHGLGAIAIAREALADESAARALADRVALDVAAYDQRGCLSPHFVVVEAGAAVTSGAFARLLAGALAQIERTLPRGLLPQAAAAAQLQWRGVAAAIGELHGGGTFAVSHERDQPLRVSPGYRNVAVHEAPDLRAIRAQLAALGRHLKALGLAGDRARSALADLAPYPCDAGAMQTPPLAAPLDGLHPLAGWRD